MKPIYQVLSVIGLTAILTSQTTLSQAQNKPTRSPSRILYIARINAKDLVNRAVIKAQSGDNQGAIFDLTEAIKIDAEYAPAYHYRGIVRSAMGDKPGAIADFQSAADLFQKQGKIDDYQLSMNAILYLRR